MVTGSTIRIAPSTPAVAAPGVGVPGIGTLQGSAVVAGNGEPPEVHQAALQSERQFAQQAMQQLHLRMVSLETPHFAIWTTVPADFHKVLTTQCEAMYTALARIFRLPANQPIFLGKCGVFVLANQEQFKTFCQYVQEIPPEHARRASGFHVGTSDGRSRILAFWPGNTQELAEVLVHEGSHAFLQRYLNDNATITWFNEGLAEHVTAQVFGSRCLQGREAMQQAADLLREDPKILPKLLAVTETPLPGQYYPLAQSVVAYLARTNPNAFVQTIQGLKNTEPFGQVLQRTYKIGIPGLDLQWRSWLLQTAQSGKALY